MKLHFYRSCLTRSAWLVGCWVQTTLPTCLTKTIFQTHNSTRYSFDFLRYYEKFPISRERFRVCCRADVHAGPVPKPISFHLVVKWRPRINTVIWVWIAEQGASFPLGASWWAPKLEDEKVQQYNQQPQRAASHCHFDHVTVCVCVRARDCSVKKPVAHRALHHLISLTHTSSSQANEVVSSFF